MRVRPAGLALALLAIAIGTGCVGSEDAIDRDIRIVDAPTDPDQTREDEEYWMVWIRGNETDERRNPFVCARVPPDYRIHHANRSVTYRNGSYDFDPTEVEVLLAFDHEDRSSSCPEAERLVADPGPEHVEEMGEYGQLALAVETDGTLVVDELAVPLGKAAQASYAGTPEDPDKLRVDGGFRAEVLGAWPRENLTATGG